MHAVICMMCTTFVRADDIVVNDPGLAIDVSPSNGQLALQIRGGIWVLPANGGDATRITTADRFAARPRWSPGGDKVAYEVSDVTGPQVWIYDLASGSHRALGGSTEHQEHASWHPDGSKIVYASKQNNDHDNTGLDIWETDIETGVSWRVTRLPGDESDPVWSPNGKHLAFVHEYSPEEAPAGSSTDRILTIDPDIDPDIDNRRFELMLQRRGQPLVTLRRSITPLSSPSWRPDGSLIAYRRESGFEMVVLSNPVLARPLLEGTQFHDGRLGWKDRQQMIYAANGGIREQRFGSSRSRPLRFRAAIPEPVKKPRKEVTRRLLTVNDAAGGKLVIRARRLFDGVWPGYRENMDVVIEGGRIVAVVERNAPVSADTPADATVVDLGDVTVLPGLLDALSDAPRRASDGASILASGVTTIVAELDSSVVDLHRWDGPTMPGPRVLSAKAVATVATDDAGAAPFVVTLNPDIAANQLAAVVASWREVGAWVAADARMGPSAIDVDFGINLLEQSNNGRATINAGSPADQIDSVTWMSGLASKSTPGVAALADVRQAPDGFFGRPGNPRTRRSIDLVSGSDATVIAASKPNGLPAGLALHAELRAMVAAGLSPEQALHRAGKDAAFWLGLENQVGTIVPGAFADLVVVSGDPLRRIEDALDIIGVVRNGRFFSLVSLLETADSLQNVE